MCYADTKEIDFKFSGKSGNYRGIRESHFMSWLGTLIIYRNVEFFPSVNFILKNVEFWENIHFFEI